MTAAAGVCLAATLVDCTTQHDHEQHGHEQGAPAAALEASVQPTMYARARVASLRQRAGRMDLGRDADPKAVRWHASPGLGFAIHGPEVDLELPSNAAGGVRIRDRRSDLSVAFALQDARSVDGERVDELVVYPAAGPHGSDVLQRVHSTGVEDYLLFHQRPDATVVRYAVDVTSVAGLRMVADTLEMLDTRGVPRLRIQPPYLLAADGKRHEARLALEGCSADRDPQPPWDRPVVPPGSHACTVAVSWPERGVAYPAYLDPEWVATANTMATPRHRHSVSELTPGAPASISLIAGGFDGAGNAVATAELYHPLERSFASTGSLDVARGNHSATTMSSLPVVAVPQTTAASPVAIAGGSASLGAGGLDSVEIYRPATGTFVTDTSQTFAPRVRHTATLIDNATVLFAGGYGSNPNSPLTSASVYQLTGFDAGGAPISSLTATGSMNTARARHAAERLTESAGDVLVSGGLKDGVNVNQGGEVYTPNPADPTLATFALLPVNPGASQLMQVPRFDHRATRIADDEILITGGTNGTVFYDAVDIYIDKSGVVGFAFQLIPITMTALRARHSSTRLPSGKVVVAGGANASGAVGTGEVFDPATNSFDPLTVSAPLAPRSDHGGLLINAGGSLAAGRGVLVVGGLNASGQPLATAQVLLGPDGDVCSDDVECASGHCAPNDDPNLGSPGICCDSACDQLCVSCSAAGKGSGPNGACGFTAAATALPVTCTNEVEVHNSCDGNGQVLTPLAIDCKPSTCNAAGTACSIACDSTAACSKSGWCDLTISPTTTGGAGGSGATGGSGSGATGGSGGGAGTGGSGGGTTQGSCQPRRPLGTICERDEQCLGAANSIDLVGHCVDGFCCESTCNNQCQACDVDGNEGKCVAVAAGDQPHPNATVEPGSGGAGGAADVDVMRTPCAGAGTDCSGYCDGNDVIACAFPDAQTQEGDASCSCPDADCAVGPATVTRRVCDSMGSFENVEQDCAGFRCDADGKECLASCTTDGDCVEDYLCNSTTLACEALTGPTCDGDKTLLIPMGSDVDCTPFACPRGSSACPSTCSSVDDCATPSVCNGAGQCVEPPSDGAVSNCSCRVAGARERPDEGSPRWLALGVLALLTRRRRGTRRRP